MRLRTTFFSVVWLLAILPAIAFAPSPACRAIKDSLSRGKCLIQRGYPQQAKALFEEQLQKQSSDANANFGAALSDLLILIDDFYSGALKLSYQQQKSFTLFQKFLSEKIGGEKNGRLIRLQTMQQRFQKAAETPNFKFNVDGIVLRLHFLEGYLDFLELDRGDAYLFSAVANLLQALIDFTQAYDLDIPISKMLNKGAPIYTLFKLDLEQVLKSPDYPHFLAPRKGGNKWTKQARLKILAALDDVEQGIGVIMQETDNQTTPDLAEDYPDLFSQSYFTLQGDIFIPGIFGPSPTTSILSTLFRKTRQELISDLQKLFPPSPNTFPELFIHILKKLQTALDSRQPITLFGLKLKLKSLFLRPPNLRLLLPMLTSASKSTSGGTIDSLQTLPNRARGKPPQYKKTPTVADLEKDAARGFDGAAAEIHTGNGYLTAGFTREGRLKNLFFPGSTSFNHIPYLTRVKAPFLDFDPIPYMGANPEHGSFAGVRIGKKFSWLMDWLDYKHLDPKALKKRKIQLHYRSPTEDFIQITYKSPQLSVRELSFVPKKRGAKPQNLVVRSFTLTNRGAQPIPLHFVYYGAFDLTNIDQYMLGSRFKTNWLLTENSIAKDGDGILWTGPGWQVEPDYKQLALMIAADSTYPLLRASLGEVAHHQGAFKLAEQGKTSKRQRLTSNFGNGYLEWDLGTLGAHQSKTITVLLSLGHGATSKAASRQAEKQLIQARQQGIGSLNKSTQRYWKKWFVSVKIPTSLTKRERAVYQRSALLLKLSQSQLTGALPEMLDMQPMWFMVWPGNAIWHALALEALGKTKEAEQVSRFFERTQARDGHWRMAYTVLGDYHGAFEMEEYHTPAILFYFWVHWKNTHSDAFVRRYYPTIKKGADFVVSRIAQNGLLYASPDYVEDLTSFRQSLFTNTIAVSGLLCAKEIAEQMKDKESAARYQRAAERIRQAVLTILWNEQEKNFFAEHDMNGSHSLGGQPTMVFPFRVFLPTDPKIQHYKQRSLDPAIEKQNFTNFENSEDWTPSLLMKALFYYDSYQQTKEKHSLQLADKIVQGILHNLTLAGFIPERYFGNGVLGSSKPLVWPHSLFILSMQVKSRTFNLPLPHAYR